jgi:hypothetical protein
MTRNPFSLTHLIGSKIPDLGNGAYIVHVCLGIKVVGGTRISMMKARTPRAIYVKAWASIKQNLENECLEFSYC